MLLIYTRFIDNNLFEKRFHINKLPIYHKAYCLVLFFIREKVPIWVHIGIFSLYLCIISYTQNHI